MDIFYNLRCIIMIVDDLIAPGTSVFLCINISCHSFPPFCPLELLFYFLKKDIQTCLLVYFIFFM